MPKVNKESKNSDGKSNEKPQPWWGTLPGILTGIALTITAVGGLITALNPVAPRPTSTVISSPTSPSVVSCPDYFDGLKQQTKPIKVELDRLQYQIDIAPAKAENDYIGIQLTDYNKIVASLKFKFSASEDVFKIASMIDAQCQELLGAESKPVKSASEFDLLEKYRVRLTYTSGNVLVDFRKK
jgi:hypothetical protein